jgi:hypothetical protein
VGSGGTSSSRMISSLQLPIKSYVAHVGETVGALFGSALFGLLSYLTSVVSGGILLS